MDVAFVVKIAAIGLIVAVNSAVSSMKIVKFV